MLTDLTVLRKRELGNDAAAVALKDVRLLNVKRHTRLLLAVLFTLHNQSAAAQPDATSYEIMILAHPGLLMRQRLCRVYSQYRRELLLRFQYPRRFAVLDAILAVLRVRRGLRYVLFAVELRFHVLLRLNILLPPS